MDLVAKRIHLRRSQLGLTQSDLSQLSGISQTQISKYELGQSQPTAPMLFQLARALKTSVDWLIGFSDEIKVSPGEELTELERQIIEIVRSKSPEQQRKVLEIAKML